MLEKVKIIMEYLTTVELSKKWGISSRRIGVLCSEGRIDGVVKKGKNFMFITIIPNTYISANLVDMFYTFFQNKFRRLLHYI